MKGVIEDDGCLWMERGVSGEMVKQLCPYAPTAKYCGYRCPLFGEPGLEGDRGGYLEICNNRVLYFTELTDGVELQNIKKY